MPLPTLALCLEYPLALRGGVSVLVEELARGLAPHFRIVLVSPDETGAFDRQPARRCFAGHVQWLPAKASARTSRQLAERLREHGCDLAHLHIGGVYGWGLRWPGCSPFGFLARAGIAVCSTVHLTVSLLDGYCGPAKPLWWKLALLPVAWLGKLDALRHTHAELAVSRHDEADLRRWFAPLAGRFRTIYHSRLRAGVESPHAVRETTILNVGHIAHRKGQHLLVEAFARVAPRHPRWQLHLAGPLDDAECAVRVRRAIEASGVQHRIHLLGSREDAQELMNSAGIYVQPSIHEALGLALQEALYAGCPCIGTTAGGIPELIADDENGLLVQANDASALGEALERLMADDALRARLSERARASIVERGMTSEHMIQQHLALYREALSRR